MNCLSKNVVFLIVSSCVLGTTAHAQELPENPLASHMAHMMEGSGDWRTPNPDHDPKNKKSPVEFSVQWKWGPNKKHIVGELTGVFENGTTAQYQSMYTIYNPVTQRVIMQQVGWNGTYMLGDASVRMVPLSIGDSENVDMTAYAPDGTAKHTRHKATIVDRNTHQIDLYEKDENGVWLLKREWTWRLHEAD